MASVTRIFKLIVIVLYIQKSLATSSVAMPYCKTKQRCDEIWEAPDFSDCINEFCMCTRGSEYVESLQTCLCRDGHVVGSKGCLPAAIQLGSSCEESIQCTALGEHVTCDKGKCNCLKDALNIGRTCHKKKYHNQTCTLKEECAHISKLVCLGDRCVCEEDHFLSPDEQSCLSRLSRLSDHCHDDIQCSESFGRGSHCRETCVCKEGFREFNNEKCVLYRKENEECSSTADCFSDLKCVEGKCFRETKETTENRAVTEVKRTNDALLDDQCIVDRNCITALTVCESGRCRCFRGHNPSPDRRTCIATTRGMCFEESDCRTLQFSSCLLLDASEGTCTCRDGYSASQNFSRCLPDSFNQGACEESVQCTSPLGFNSLCREGRCECQTQFHFSVLDGRCIRSVGLEESCQNNSQCVAGGSQNNVFCENGRCSCTNGFVRDQDSCRAGAQNVVVSGIVFLLYWIIKAVIH